MSLIALATLSLATPFGLLHEGGRDWFKDPAGKPFWSLGVDCVDPGTPWDAYHSANRSYAAFQQFPSGAAWVDHVQSELSSMGVNSLGGWSEIDLFRKYGGAKRLPYFVVLHLGAYDQAPWHDLFAPQMERAVDGAAKSQIPKLKDDPYLVGYFSDNELGWWDDTLFLNYAKFPLGSPGRAKLNATIRAFYGSDFGRLKRDWTVSAKSFAELAAKPGMTLREGGQGIRLVHEFNRVLADRYYSLMQRTIRKYDRNHLILGDRYCQYYNLETARASAKYIDVASTNYGADWNDGSYARFFLSTLHRLTGRPIVITEFYMGARENRSGNRNSGDAFPKVQTQAERATAFAKCIETFATTPFVIGAHWFQYSDEPEHGRGDGEDWNMGLVDIEGKPYEGMADAMRKSDPAQVHRAAGAPPVCTTVPVAPANPMSGLRDWDRGNGFIPVTSGDGHGDLYLARDDRAVYFGLFAQDYADNGLYANGKMPESERPKLRVDIVGARGFTVRYGGGGAPTVDAGYEVGQVPGLRHTIIVRVPLDRLPATGELKFSATAWTHSRGYSTHWQRQVALR